MKCKERIHSLVCNKYENSLLLSYVTFYTFVETLNYIFMIPTKNFFLKTDYFLRKIKKTAKNIGRTGLKPILTLYFIMKSPLTPKSDKLIIMGALAYLALPINILSSKNLPIIGWADEIAAIILTYKKMKKHITPEIENRVNTFLNEWLPEYTDYEIVTE